MKGEKEAHDVTPDLAGKWLSGELARSEGSPALPFN